MDVTFVPTSGAQPFSIEVGFFDTILEMKLKIEKYKGIAAASQILAFKDQSLQDGREARSYEILHNSQISLTTTTASPPNQEKITPNNNDREKSPSAPSPQKVQNHQRPPRRVSPAKPKKMKLTVVSKCGMRELGVEVNPSDNVEELKKHLQVSQQQQNFPLPVEGYFFIYKQSVMDDDRSFHWHCVGEGDTIEIFNGTVSGGSF